MPEVRIVKRYANRKLYDTQHSRYVTLDQISEMIRDGDDVKIIDNKTKEDLTSITLAQIIFENEKKQKSFLPLQTMRNIIQSGGESITQFVSEAQRRVTSAFKKDAEEDPTKRRAESGKPAAGNLAELREWIVSSQQTIDEWQRRVDGTIRTVVGGMSPFASVQKELIGLKTRIGELEAKLKQLMPPEPPP